MDFEVINKAISVTESLFDGFDEQPVDCDFTLPDYYPDIAAVLKCSLTPIVQSKQISGDRVTVDGIALVELLYLDEERKNIHSVEFTKPFTSVFNLKSGVDSPFIKAVAKTDYVNCRALSPRRLDAHGSFNVRLKVQAEGTAEIVADIEGESIEIRKSSVSYTVPAISSEKTFTLNEVLDIGADNPSIEKIIRNDVSVTVQDVKILSNKAIIKGEATVKCLYISDFSDGTTQKLVNKIPFSQIVDSDGLNEDDLSDITLAVISSSVRTETNQNGEARLLEIMIKLSAVIQTFLTGETEIITDSYSTEFPLNIEKKRIEVEHLEDIRVDRVKIKEEFDLPNSDISEIIDIWCEIGVAGVEYIGEITKLSAKLTTHMLARDFEGDVAYFERSGDVFFDFEDGCNQSVCDLSVVEVEFSKTGSNKCEVFAEVNAKRFCYNVENVLAVVNAESDENAKYPKEQVTLKIYFADKGESIWEVAKACHASVDDVMDANSLYDDILTEDSRILVPLN